MKDIPALGLGLQEQLGPPGRAMASNSEHKMCEGGVPMPSLPVLQAPCPAPVPGMRQLDKQELCRALKPRAKVHH